jgi:hypothetical protein
MRTASRTKTPFWWLTVGNLCGNVVSDAAAAGVPHTLSRSRAWVARVCERRQEAIRLMTVSMQQSAMDQRTGMIDMDKILRRGCDGPPAADAPHDVIRNPASTLTSVSNFKLLGHNCSSANCQGET